MFYELSEVEETDTYSIVSHFMEDPIFIFIWDLILLTAFDKSDSGEILTYL